MSVGYKDRYRSIISKTKQLLIDYYSKRLTSIVLYGSVGRGLFSPESDIDLLIVIKDAPRSRYDRFMEYYNNVYKKIEQDIRTEQKNGLNLQLSVIIKTDTEVLYGSPLFIEMVDNCVLLYDLDKFFEETLDQIRERMEKYGSKKIQFKGRYYWKLKSDYKWGDTIEI